MPDKTLFDHADDYTNDYHDLQDAGVQPGNTERVPAPPCKTLRQRIGEDPEKAALHICRCSLPDRSESGLPCAFSDWLVVVAKRLSEVAPKDADLRGFGDVEDLTPERPLEFMLSKKALGANYNSETLAFPGFYAFHDNLADQGVMLISILYSQAIDPAGDLGIDHRAGYRSEPGRYIVGRYFAAGFKEKGNNGAELAYCENHIDLRTLVCRSQEDLEGLYEKILLTKAKS